MHSLLNDAHNDTSSTIEPNTENLLEGGRGCRNKKKQMDPSCCPICSVTIRVSELNTHLGIEMERLSKLSNQKHKQSPRRMSPPSASGASASVEGVAKYWETYQKVKTNRHGRLKVKAKKRKPEELSCPVCNKFTSDDITLHVEMCLERMDTSETLSDGSDDENIDVEGDDMKFEEYEWAGQTRVRASSLLEGGFSGLGIGTSICKPNIEDEDADIVVDGDDSQVYGSFHYTEQDVLNYTMGENSHLTDIDFIDVPLNAEKKNRNKSDQDLAKDTIIESLKLKIRELEDREPTKEQFKCLICMGRYKTPVVSILCWHVHCEKCWLQTLAAKKICPQCNVITSAHELRRIYM